MVTNGQNGDKWSKWWEMVKMVRNGHNGDKWSKWWQMIKMVTNACLSVCPIKTIIVCLFVAIFATFRQLVLVLTMFWLFLPILIMPASTALPTLTTANLQLVLPPFLLPHSVLSCNLSLAEDLKSLSLQDGATEWHYYLTRPDKLQQHRNKLQQHQNKLRQHSR